MVLEALRGSHRGRVSRRISAHRARSRPAGAVGGKQKVQSNWAEETERKTSRQGQGRQGTACEVGQVGCMECSMELAVRTGECAC